ncbi:SapC family protein [Aliiglaciecola sp. LCG003]|uniref:SapC family protein n=1 Tax=Aliiglaciecola sp. LCG003 TaxID=3053655 RepID=UPI0025726230|nr:SapC family protein [Aliiglaciecola sp. LCG003]WJG08740.1 SapC family protein [Aliiglaciecola sp. LCG003]
MKTNYIPLDKEKHSALKVNTKHNFEFAKETHLASATLREFAQIASCMPIIFIKDQPNGSFHTIAMLGLEPSSNLYFSQDKWQGHVMPLNIQRFPFDVRPDGDKLGVFIDENSELVGDEGESLFTAEGEPSEYLKNRQDLLGEVANSELATQRFVKRIVELELLDEVQLNVQYATGEKRNVTGLFSINEKRVNELSDETILELKKNGYLGAIYTVMLSLAQLNRLVQLSANTDKPIRGIQLSLVGDKAQAPAAN